MKRIPFLPVSLAGLLLLGAASDVKAAAVTNHSSFSVGYGFSDGWTTRETSSANQPQGMPLPGGSGIFTNGDFVIAIDVSGNFNSSEGVSFTNRVLTIGEQTAQSVDTTVRIAIDYIGGTPTNAAVRPDYTLQLHIERLSVFATKVSEQLAGSTNHIWWVETTPSHTNQSSVVTTPLDSPFTLATSYAKVEWSPSDFNEVGNHCERTFAFPTDRNFLLDGLEIVGDARLIYQASPGRSDP